MQQIRQRSLSIADSLGYRINENLPLLEERVTIAQSVQDIVHRMLAIYIVAAVAYGFDRKKALGWLTQNVSTRALTMKECRFLKEGEGAPDGFKYQIEGLWAFFWSCSLVEDCEFSFARRCPEDFALRLPDLNSGQKASEVFRSSKIRDIDEIVSMADLAYCVHWSVRDAELQGSRSTPLPYYVVVERRRAFEWLLGGYDWENISLDT